MRWLHIFADLLNLNETRKLSGVELSFRGTLFPIELGSDAWRVRALIGMDRAEGMLMYGITLNKDWGPPPRNTFVIRRRR